MEKMTSKSECNHVKVFSNVFLASLPHQRPWICSLCGTEGADRKASMSVKTDGAEYDAIKERKERGFFNVAR